MPQFKPGLCSVTFRDFAFEQVIDLAVGAQLEAIEWGADVHAPPGTAQADTIGTATRDAGLAVSSYGSYLRAGVSSHDELMEVIATALALGAPMIRVWAGARNKPSTAYTRDERARVADWLNSAGAAAGQHGLAIGIEFHPATLTDALASTVDLMAKLTGDNIYLYWQPYPGLPCADGLAQIASVGADIAHLHVFAWDTEAARYPLSRQSEDWRGWISAVPSGRWSGPRYAMLEFLSNDDPAALISDANVLREHILSIKGAGKS